MGIQLLSMVLGLAAIRGRGEARRVPGILAAGQQAAMGKYLSFSPRQEAARDAAAL
jgi:hypothetical protein